MQTTTAMAADLSGVPQRTIQRWAAEGRITSEIRAGNVHVNAAEVSELAEHRHAGRLPRIDARSSSGASLPHGGCAVSSMDATCRIGDGTDKRSGKLDVTDSSLGPVRSWSLRTGASEGEITTWWGQELAVTMWGVVADQDVVFTGSAWLTIAEPKPPSLSGGSAMVVLLAGSGALIGYDLARELVRAALDTDR